MAGDTCRARLHLKQQEACQRHGGGERDAGRPARGHPAAIRRSRHPGPTLAEDCILAACALPPDQSDRAPPSRIVIAESVTPVPDDRPVRRRDALPVRARGRRRHGDPVPGGGRRAAGRAGHRHATVRVRLHGGAAAGRLAEAAAEGRAADGRVSRRRRRGAARAAPLLIGGKSMGGRVASLVADELYAAGRIAGLVCLGYPFHPPGQARATAHGASRRTELPGADRAGRARSVRHSRGGRGLRLSPAIRLHWAGDGDHDLGPARRLRLHAQRQSRRRGRRHRRVRQGRRLGSTRQR